MEWTDLITLKELSPELRRLITAGGGGGGTIGESPIFIDGVYTKKVVATTQDQVEFEIPFEEYDTVNTYLDIKINSTWINPDRYTIEDSKVILNDGVDIGTTVYFTIFSLAQVSPDGGYIEDVDVAETPQEVIIYDGSIIDEKVKTHNKDKESHPDIRHILSNGVMARYDTVTLEVLNDANYRTPYTTTIDVEKATAIGLGGDYYNIIYQPNIDPNGYGTQIAIRFHVGTIHTRVGNGVEWRDWKEFATQDQVDILANDRGYIDTPRLKDANLASESGKYILDDDAINSPKLGWSFTVETIKMSDYGNRTQIAVAYYPVAEAFMYIRHSTNDSWSTWKEIVTTEKVIDLPLLNGWEIANSENVILAKNGNVVTITGGIQGGTRDSWTYIATLPEGYRPRFNTEVPLGAYAGTIHPTSRLFIETSGKISIHDAQDTTGALVINASLIV